MRCDCYHVIEEKPGKFSGECWGTKERERCYCGGNMSHCIYYPEKRNVATDTERKDKNMNKEKTILNTAEMMIEAAKTHETYQCGDILFNTTKSFFNVINGEPWSISAFNTLQEIFDLHWIKCRGQVMTKAKAESKFNIKIIG